MKKTTGLFFLLYLTAFCCGQTSNDYYQKGLEAFKIKDYSTAIKYLSNAIEINSKCIDCFSKKSLAEMAISDFTSAKIDINQAINFEPKKDTFYVYRAIFEDVLKDYPEARAC
jgi:tetratricopeptide (TPR) repeat protein